MKKLSFSRYFCRVRQLDAPLLTKSAQMHILYRCERAIGITLL